MCANYELIGNIFCVFVRTNDGEKVCLSKINFKKRCPGEIYINDFAMDDRVLNLVISNKRR